MTGYDDDLENYSADELGDEEANYTDSSFDDVDEYDGPTMGESADSKADRLSQAIRENFFYGIIVVLVMIPGVMQLKKMFAEPEAPKQAPISLAFDGASNELPDVPKEVPSSLQELLEADTETGPAQGGVIRDEAAVPDGIDDLLQKEDDPLADFLEQSVDPAGFASEVAVSHGDAMSAAMLDEHLAPIQETLSDLLHGLGVVESKLENVNTHPQLDERLATIQTHLSEVAKMQKALVAMGQEIRRLSVVVGEQHAEMNDLRELKTMVQQAADDALVVAAAIPGRVWLKDSRGMVINVAEGEPLLGFGRVTEVDPVAGKVKTSSGVTFSVEPNQP